MILIRLRNATCYWIFYTFTIESELNNNVYLFKEISKNNQNNIFAIRISFKCELYSSQLFPQNQTKSTKMKHSLMLD